MPRRLRAWRPRGGAWKLRMRASANALSNNGWGRRWSVGGPDRRLVGIADGGMRLRLRSRRRHAG